MNYKLSREAHGLVSGVGMGDSPTIGNIAAHWKKPPTSIMPGSSRTASAITNPFDPKSRRTANPSASQTITDLNSNRPKKRRKTTQAGFEGSSTESKFFRHSSRISPSVAASAPSSSIATAIESRPSSVTTRSMDESNAIIDIDDDNKTSIKGKGKASKSPILSNGSDELDLLENTSELSSILKSSTIKSKKYGGGFVLPDIASAIRESARRDPSWRKMAKDGESLNRLKKKLRPVINSFSLSRNSPSNSPVPKEVEEIEDSEIKSISGSSLNTGKRALANTVDYGPLSTPRKRSSSLSPRRHYRLNREQEQSDSEDGLKPQVSDDHHCDSKAGNELEQPSNDDVPGRVNGKLTSERFEPSKKAFNFAGLQPGTVKTLASRLQDTSSMRQIDLKNFKLQSQKMKTKNGLKPSFGKRLDPAATSSTQYENPSLKASIDEYQWGATPSNKSNDSETTKFWLMLDEREMKLKLIEEPSTKLSKVRKSLSYDEIKRAKVTVSIPTQNSTVEFLRLDLQDCAGLPDDLKHIGVAIFFHLNQDHLPMLLNRIHDLTFNPSRRSEYTIMTAQTRKSQLDVIQRRVAEYHGDAEVTEHADTRLEQIHPGPEQAASTSKLVIRPTPRYKGKAQGSDEVKVVPVRRSGRLSNDMRDDTAERKTTPTNLDEVILVYPPSGIGAVNITAGDLRRLEPSEFLNDSVIEFGLKFWLNGLRRVQPELAEEIYVFSSFFYKKLNHRIFSEGYKSVRKWTAKLDLFKKKYIIVPINENFHWYLAIIYRPEHILERSPQKPVPRSSKRKTRETALASSEKEDSELLTDIATVRATSRARSVIEKVGDGEREDDAAVEEAIQLTRDCSIEDEAGDDNFLLQFIQPHSPCPESARPESLRSESPQLLYPTEDNDTIMSFSPSVGRGELIGGGRATETIPDSESDEVDELEEDDSPQQGFSLVNSQDSEHSFGDPLNSFFEADTAKNTRNTGARKNTIRDFFKANTEASSRTSTTSSRRASSAEDRGSVGKDGCHKSTNEAERESCNVTLGDATEHVQDKDKSAAVPSDSFYNSPGKTIGTYTSKGKQTSQVSNRVNRSSKGDSSLILDDDEPDTSRTWIFCFDSLGSKHPRALKKLNDYLRAEAEDKKGVKDADHALTKMALPLYQPNFCDCGLYLLHFATTFLSDPEKYMKITASKKKYSKEEVEELWYGSKVTSLREELKAQLLSEAETWKESKAKTENPEKRPLSSAPSSSDDEIEVSEVRKHKSTGYTPRKRARNSTAAAPATRLRG